MRQAIQTEQTKANRGKQRIPPITIRFNTIMEVWYQLCVGDVPHGQPSKERLEDNADIADLKQAVKKEWGVHLPCATPMLKMFAAGADPNNDEHLDPGDSVPEGTTSKNPLVVVAPPPLQQQIGELRSCLLSYSSAQYADSDAYGNAKRLV